MWAVDIRKRATHLGRWREREVSGSFLVVVGLLDAAILFSLTRFFPFLRWLGRFVLRRFAPLEGILSRSAWRHCDVTGGD
jgi:high-affinity nickel permease